MIEQKVFESVYRGKNGRLRHMAYMQMAKVLLTLHTLNKVGLSTDQKAIMDHGFGSGTFFRYCARSARLHGVEVDPQTVKETSQMLRSAGFSNVDLQPVNPSQWQFPSTLLGFRTWWALSRSFAAIGFKPTQAAFVLSSIH